MGRLTKQTANEPHTFERLKSTLRVLFDGLDMIYTGELPARPLVDPCKAPQGPETRVDAEQYAMQNAI